MNPKSKPPRIKQCNASTSPLKSRLAKVVLLVFVAIIASWTRAGEQLARIIETTTTAIIGKCKSSSSSFDSSSEVKSCDDVAATSSSRPHRGEVIGANVRASDLARAYRSIKAEYSALALHPTSASLWRVIKSHPDGSEVSLLDHPTDPSCPYVRMTSIMPGTIRDVWDFLDMSNWGTNMPKMDPFYDGLDVYGEYEHDGIRMKLARKTIKRLVTFGKRDFAFVSVSDHPRSNDGAWVSGTVSVVTDAIPRMAGYVRAYQDSVAFYEALDDDPSTGMKRMKLTIVFRLDLNDSTDGGDGGYVPMFVYVKTVGTTGMASVQTMKRLIAESNRGRKRDDDSKSCNENWMAKIWNGVRKGCDNG